MESVILSVAKAAAGGRGVHEASGTEADEGFPAPGRTGGKSQRWKRPVSKWHEMWHEMWRIAENSWYH